MITLETWRKLSRLWVNWTLMTTVAGLLIYPLTVALAGLGGGWPTGYWFALPLAGAIAGLVAGIGQERTIRDLLPLTRQWIGATVLAWAVGFSLAVGLTVWVRPVAMVLESWYGLTLYLIVAGVAGAVSGVGQWRLLKTRIEKSIWWLMACGVGSLLSWLAVTAAWWFLGQGADWPTSLAQWPVLLALGGMAGWMLGMEQGIALVGLIAQEEWEKQRINRSSLPF